jgi:hypothetical protein
MDLSRGLGDVYKRQGLNMNDFMNKLEKEIYD